MSIVVSGIAVLTILGDLGFNLTPLLLSTTVLGVALGFGAQNLVRDYLAGILMLVEDQYGVGDVIPVRTRPGRWRTMTLLITRLRDVNGIVWHIRNGTIESVGNESQGWSRAVIDYPVPYEEDLGRIRRAAGAGARRCRNVRLGRSHDRAPEVWGAQEMSSGEVTMRIVAKTVPMRQWEVEPGSYGPGSRRRWRAGWPRRRTHRGHRAAGRGAVPRHPAGRRLFR